MDWLDQRSIDELDARAERALRAAGLHFEQDAVAERWLSEAATIAPDHPAVLLGHYRYHLYKHHYPEAEQYARRCLASAAEELGLPRELLETHTTHADFTSSDARVRFWLGPCSASPHAPQPTQSAARTKANEVPRRSNAGCCACSVWSAVYLRSRSRRSMIAVANTTNRRKVDVLRLRKLWKTRCLRVAQRLLKQ